MENTLIKKSRDFAMKAHEGQVRKTSGRPYVTHVFRVAQILIDAGMPVVAICAAFNHDVVEDTTLTIEDIERELGIDVAKLVAFNTEDKTKTWEERKAHTIKQLKHADLYEKALVVADKYANLLEMIENSHEFGREKVFSFFKRGEEHQYYYFSGVASSALENVDKDSIPAFFLEYQRAVEDFFKKNI